MHLGLARRVVTLAINQRDDAQAFLSKLKKTDTKKYDEIDDEEHLILCTNGGKKNKQQSADIALAKKIKAEYLNAKKQPDTILKLKD